MYTKKNIYFIAMVLLGISTISLTTARAEEFLQAEELEPVIGAGEVSPLPDLQVEDLYVEIEEDDPAEKEQEEEKVNFDSLGVLSPGNGGVRLTYWADRSYDDIVNILNRLNISTNSRAYNTFLERLILSTTTTPMPEKEGDWGKIIDVRIKKLINSGRFEQARLLINALPEPMRTNLYGKQIVEMGLVDFNNTSVCETVYSRSPETARLPFWKITDVICSVIAGEKAGVEYKLQQIKSENITMPNGLQALILNAINNRDIAQDVQIEINPWSLNLMRLLGYGIVVPDELDSIYIKRGLLFNTGVDAYDRTLLAEEMFTHSAITPKILYAVYNSVPNSYSFTDADDGTFTDKEASKTNDLSDTKALGSHQVPLPFVRMQAYKYILEAKSLRDKVLRVKQVFDSAKTYAEKIKTLEIFAPMFVDIQPNNSWEGQKIARMFYAVGDFVNAEKWAGKNPTVFWFEKSLAERFSDPKNAVVFKQSGGLFSEIDEIDRLKQTSLPKKKTGIFASFFGSSNSNKTENYEGSLENGEQGYVNENSLAENGQKRRAWIQWVEDKYNTEDTFVGSMYITQAFLILESLGYKISDGAWVYISQKSTFVEKNVISPAKIRALNILLKDAIDPIYVLMAVKEFIEQTEISDIEFAKVLNVLYRAGYGDLAQKLAFERIVYHTW